MKIPAKKEWNEATDWVVTYGDEVTLRKGAIIDLAVHYSNFMEAAKAGRLVDAKAFALGLDEAQKATGVELLSDRTLRDYL